MNMNAKYASFANAAFLFLFSLFLAGCPGAVPEDSTTITNLSFKIGTGTNPVIGNQNAPITIVEFTDYQCPYCKRHAENTFQKIEENYVKDGKVNYYLRDFPLSQIHKNAKSAATAARCAGAHGKYWEMHALLFSKQQEWEGLSANSLSQKFSEYAGSFGINQEAFLSCYAGADYESQISADISDALDYGISGTPSSVVILPKTANETKMLAVLSEYPDYAAKGMLALSKNAEGDYAFFIKGAFPYEIFQKVLDSY